MRNKIRGVVEGGRWFLKTWWSGKRWDRLQKEFEKSGTRYYGDGGTIHSSGQLDVETYHGSVVAVWFRCQHLPFRQSETNVTRLLEMTRLYKEAPAPGLHGVEVEK